MRRFLKITLIIILVLASAGALAYSLPLATKTSYVRGENKETTPTEQVKEAPPVDTTPVRVVTHIPTPDIVKGIYMTSWVAGTNSLRSKIISLIDTTEANTIIIDIKDYTGKVSFHMPDEKLEATGAMENRIRDIANLIDELHAKHIYVIGRIAVFQDPYFGKAHPEALVKKSSDKTVPWGDKKGIHWLDAGSEDVWNYVAAIGDDSYVMGFDEINFDYIRFPSDGNMKDIWYPISEGKSKTEVMNSFFTFLDTHFHEQHIPISADVFGMTTTATDDLGIGQLFENAVAHFDFVAPMVYPSHYPPTWNGFKNPADHPKEVITISMASAAKRVTAAGKDPNKVLRPWLQDFDLGAKYTAEMVRAQIDAGNALGLDSWMLWDASNTYTESALKKE